MDKICLLILTLLITINGFAQKEKPNLNTSMPIITITQIKDISEEYPEYYEKPNKKEENISLRYFNSEQLQNLCNIYINNIYRAKQLALRNTCQNNRSFGQISHYQLANNNIGDNNKLCYLPPDDTLFVIGDTIIRINSNHKYHLENGLYTVLDTIETSTWEEELELIPIKEQWGLPEKIYGIITYENWYFDYKAGNFYKKIYGFNLVEYFDCDGMFDQPPKLKPLFNGIMDMKPYIAEIYKEKEEANYLYTDKNIIIDSMVYEIPIAKNQNDTYINGILESNTNPDSYIEPTNRNKLISSILKSIYEKKCSVFRMADNKIDRNIKVSFNDFIKLTSFSTQKITAFNNSKFEKYNNRKYKTVKKVKKSIEYIYQLDKYGEPEFDDNLNYIIKDTITVYDTLWVFTDEVLQDISINFTDTIWHNTMSDITGIRFYETWYFDIENFSFYKQVNGICFLLSGFWNTKERFGTKYKLQGKFPEKYKNCGFYIDLNN